jgi:acyl-CoA synthetase (AMP-forming)/AMP-acid ligase II
MFDNHVYIFTSGTTGLPKAAYFPRQRMLVGGIYMGQVLGQFTSDDTIYVSTPLFHSNPLAIGIGGSFAAGATVALARKFSASRFWDEIRKYNATAFIYVGELLRYLLNQPPKPNDADNPVKTIIGNGLRPEIWMEFKNRFGIERIAEFYGTTESFGQFSNLFNFDCTCGHCSNAHAIVKYDVEEDAPIRGEDGFMQRVALGDAGLLIFPVQSDTSFLGYKDKKATEAKIFRNVFKEGDKWINSGDLMKDIGCSHAQFVDRVGDTFRWKGHNMSTTEVEKIFNGFEQVSLSTVYGVQIPGTDGRAPMATFVAKVDGDKIDFKGLAELLTNNLPPYGVPVFLRLKTKLPTTSTHKFQKGPLKKEGFDLELIEDALYVKVPREANYIPLTKVLYEDILKGNYKF